MSFPYFDPVVLAAVAAPDDSTAYSVTVVADGPNIITLNIACIGGCHNVQGTTLSVSWLAFERPVFQAAVTTAPLESTLVSGPYVTEMQQPFRENYGQVCFDESIRQNEAIPDVPSLQHACVCQCFR